MAAFDDNAGLPRPALLYSGTSRFCRFAARVVASLDRREELALLPLGDEEADRLLASVPDNARGDCWWLVLRDGTPVAGDGGGGVALLAEMRLTRWLGRALGGARAARLVDALDELVARHRGRLGQLVPDGPAPRRYP